MTISSRGIALIFGALALVYSGAALAQENLDAGKTPAQLFASDCVICHKSTRGLARAGGPFGLESFLRKHYTASRESAAAIARYLRRVDRGPPPRHHRRTARPRHEQPPKSIDKKAAKKTTKPGAAKMTDKKAGQAAPADKKSGEAKAADKKKDEAKPAPKEPAGAKSAASKPSKRKAMEAEARAIKPAAKTSGKPKTAKPVE